MAALSGVTGRLAGSSDHGRSIRVSGRLQGGLPWEILGKSNGEKCCCEDQQWYEEPLTSFFRMLDVGQKKNSPKPVTANDVKPPPVLHPHPSL